MNLRDILLVIAVFAILMVSSEYEFQELFDYNSSGSTTDYDIIRSTEMDKGKVIQIPQNSQPKRVMG